MFTIRKAQMAVFSKAALERFEDQMVGYLRIHFPIQMGGAEEFSLRRFTQEGIKKAASYGVTSREDVQAYVECMVEFGQDFDTNPNTSWAGQTLRTTCLTGSEKMKYIARFARNERKDRT